MAAVQQARQHAERADSAEGAGEQQVEPSIGDHGVRHRGMPLPNVGVLQVEANSAAPACRSAPSSVTFRSQVRRRASSPRVPHR